MANNGAIVSTEEFFSNEPSSGDLVSTDDFFGKPLTSGTVSQVAGEIPTKEYYKSVGRGVLRGGTLRNLTSEEQQIPGMKVGEFLGSAVPIAAAQAIIPASPLVTPLVRAGLGGLLYGASKASVNQTPLSQSISDVPMSGLSFMAGERIGRGVQKLFSPFASGFTPELQKAAQMAKSAGITPPLSTMVQNKGVQAMERQLEVTPFGSNITKLREKAISDYGDYVKTVANKLAIQRPAEVQGSLGKESVMGLLENHDLATSKIYNEVMPQIAGKPASTSEIANTLQSIIDRRSGLAEPSALKIIRKWQTDIGKIKNFVDLKKFGTNIGQMAKTSFNNPETSGIQSDLVNLYGAIAKDKEKTLIQNGVPQEIIDKLGEANNLFKQGFDIVKDSVFKGIVNAKPENVYQAVFIKNSPTTVRMGKELLGDNFPDITRQWFERGVLNSDGSMQSPVKINKFLKDNGSIIPEIFEGNKPVLDEFNKLKQITSLLGRGRDITQGSQTSPIAGNTALTVAMWEALTHIFSNPALSAQIAGGVGAAALTAKGFTTGFGRKLLTTGFPEVGQAVKKPVQIGVQSLMRPRETKSSLSQELQKYRQSNP